MNIKANLSLDSHIINKSRLPNFNIILSTLKNINSLILKLCLTFCVFLTQSNLSADIKNVSELFTKGISHVVPEIRTSESFPGGETTVSLTPFPSSMLPAKNLPEYKRVLFHAGKALAHQPWIKAPTTTDARDGLGPIYNARTCLACHANGGRGRMPNDDKTALFNQVVRLSIPDLGNRYKESAEPNYGSQLQTQSVALAHQLRTHISADQLEHKEVAPEAYAYIQWQKKIISYPDGETISLRYPKLLLKNLNYGKLHPKTQFSLRNAPPLHGAGLLELIEQKDIDLLADEFDNNKDGISGRVNYIWNDEIQTTMPGRFGLKANEGNVRLQTAAAFANDVGITNPAFPNQPCTKTQRLCQSSAHGNDPKTGVELSEGLLELTTNFVRNIGVPKRRNPKNKKVIAGRKLFYQNGCQQCHTPSFVTDDSKEFPHLSKQKIWPYTDLLLHDMGPELADDRPDFLATGREWKTPPLWGVGLSKAISGSSHLLHDGRAQSVEEAILWHGGEAGQSKQHFMQLMKDKRQALIKFVESL
ncbi:MAG: CxxC motif-containing protein (DUF1111 family) [Cocleimonas sp.]|jgi:CxxC motif-containing protein (DUF1111 family)